MKLIDKLSSSSKAVLAAFDPMLLILSGENQAANEAAAKIVARTKEILVETKDKVVKPKKAKKVKVIRVKPKREIVKTISVRIKQEVRRAIVALSASRSRVVQRHLGRKLGVERRQAWKGIKELETLGKEVDRALVLRKEWIIDWQFAKAKLEGLYRAIRFAGVTLAF